MGLRHPFRITVDPRTGILYWAEPGPNATTDNASQGPRGYEVVGMAKGPGNYGWPYCRGNPMTIPKHGAVTGAFCYTRYDYSGSGSAGPMYAPAALRNTSKNNTGIVNLPPMRPAEVWYPYATTNATGANFPVFRVNTSGGNAAMLGPVYHHDPARGPSRLPAVFDRHLFIVEWQRNLLFAARLDAAGDLQDIRAFRNTTGMRDSVVNGPIDLKIGPDGALYILNWVGNNYPANSGNGTFVRLAYTGPHEPVALLRNPSARPVAGTRLLVRNGRVRLAFPAGARAAELHAMDGRRLARVRAEDAAAGEVAVPGVAQGVVRVRWVRE